MTPEQTAASLQARFSDAIVAVAEFRGEWTVTVKSDSLLAVCRFLKQECGFDMLTDVAGVDNCGEEPRFELDYTLYSFAHRFWLRVKTRVPENEMTVDSVAGVWRTADWHEREAFDMFGLRFHGHPDLRRILMWDGYPYYPLRKDFPLAGMDAELPDTEADAGRVERAPMLGGPFVPGVGTQPASEREPRQYDNIAQQKDKPRTGPF